MMGLDEIKAANHFASQFGPVAGVDDVREYVVGQITEIVEMAQGGSLQHLPGTQGYLRGLLAVAKDALHEDMHALPFTEAEALANNRPFCRLCDKDEHLAIVRDLAFS